MSAARAGSREARIAFVEAFTPRIRALAHARTEDVPAIELVRAGVMGLLRALGRYDPELGTPFWAYASWWVRQAMQQQEAETGARVAAEAHPTASPWPLVGVVCGWFDDLSDSEQTIVRGRSGAGGRRQTLRELGIRLGMSAEGVRRTERRALAKLHLPATYGHGSA